MRLRRMVRNVSQQSDGWAGWPGAPAEIDCLTGDMLGATFSRLGLRKNEPHHLDKPRSEECLDRQAGRATNNSHTHVLCLPLTWSLATKQRPAVETRRGKQRAHVAAGGTTQRRPARTGGDCRQRSDRRSDRTGRGARAPARANAAAAPVVLDANRHHGRSIAAGRTARRWARRRARRVQLSAAGAPSAGCASHAAQDVAPFHPPQL
eukprot:scaffold68494_cov32-Phaeocystis_antarctica.AAC.2